MENRTHENHRVVFRLIYLLRRLTDKWASVNLSKVAAQEFNVTFLPYFMNIGDTGVSNHDLVKTIKVTKQGVSKTIKELENLHLVYTEKSDTDARSIMIYLTETGKTLFDVIKEHSEGLHEEYRKLVGTKNFEIMVDTLLKLIDFHERIEKEEL